MAHWKTRAEVASRKIDEARSTNSAYEFDSKIWADLKEFQLRYFGGKCAYCETNVVAGFWGDVEHYRPKRKVEEDPSHPGYYWTAYDPRNLMPSCQRCNQGKGKKNHFPVVDGTRAFDEAGLAAETPLLLNPYFDKPSEHLAWDFDPAKGEPTGYLRGLTDKGRVSVNVYGLNRPDLVDERLAAQNEAVTAYKLARIRDETGPLLTKLREGRLSYVAARVAAVKMWIAWYRDSLDKDQASLTAV